MKKMKNSTSLSKATTYKAKPYFLRILPNTSETKEYIELEKLLINSMLYRKE